MATYVNGRKVEFGSEEWRRGDALAGLIGEDAARAMGYTNATTSRNAFSPWKPAPIPAGYYDPNLDAQRQAASRGLLNTQQDIGLAGRRAGEDYGFSKDDINRDYTRGTEDIATNRQYEGEDYNRSVAMLTRQYGILGNQQAEQARKYGVTSGGIAMLSAAKRAENQALEQGDLDTAHRRAVAGFDLAGTRLTEDRDTSLGRAQTMYDRGVADRGTALSRAQSEDVFYGSDVDAQKAYQAQQAGYVGPTRPKNERTLPDGRVVRTINGKTYDQYGRRVR